MTNQGLLQAKINVKNEIDLKNGFSSGIVANPLLKSIEGKDGSIKLSNKDAILQFNKGNSATQHIDTIVYDDSDELNITNSLNNLENIKYLRLDANIDDSSTSKFANDISLEKLDIKNSFEAGVSAFENNKSLKQIPNVTFNSADQTSILTNAKNLLPTTIDFSNNESLDKLGVYGDESDEIDNLQAVKVNPEAPFGSQITPQIDVSYTGLNQNALVNLFNNLPYNVGYTIVGNPTINDGVVSDFSNVDYLQLSSQFRPGTNDTWEFATKVTYTNNATNVYFAVHEYFRILSTNKGRPQFAIRTQGEGGNVSNWVAYSATGDTDGVFQNNTTYYIKAGNDGTNFYFDYKIEGQDNYTRLLETSSSGWVAPSSYNGGTTIGFGFSNYYFHGSIDLNETYIKVNSIVSTGPTGYVLTGNATVTNDVLGNLDTSSTAYISSDLPSDYNKIEMVFKLGYNTTTTTSGYLPICGFGSSVSQRRIGWTFANNAGLVFKTSNSADPLSEVPNSSFNPVTTLNNNGFIFAKMLVEKINANYNVTISASADGTNWINGQTGQTDTDPIGGRSIYLLRNTSGAASGKPLLFLGSSYIKINGKLWFGHESKQVTWFNGTNAVNQRQLSSNLTIVGNPTITNGILINPTDKQNTIATTQSIDVSDNSWEMQFKLLNPTKKDAFLFRVNNSNNTRVTLHHTYGLAMFLNYPVSSTRVSVDDLSSIWNNAVNNSARQFYWKISCTGKDENNQYPITVSCGTDLSNLTSQTVTLNYTLASGIVELSSYSSYSAGTSAGYNLDLNETWIKVDGSILVHGTNPLTKTCSIIGCSGTSSLTSDDKAIATNKGWNLTVA